MNLENLENLQILLHIIEFCLFLFSLFLILIRHSTILQMPPIKFIALLTICITILAGIALCIYDIVLFTLQILQHFMN